MTEEEETMFDLMREQSKLAAEARNLMREQSKLIAEAHNRAVVDAMFGRSPTKGLLKEMD